MFMDERWHTRGFQQPVLPRLFQTAAEVGVIYGKGKRTLIVYGCRLALRRRWDAASVGGLAGSAGVGAEGTVAGSGAGADFSGLAAGLGACFLPFAASVLMWKVTL